MTPCHCALQHERSRRVVLTGGPGAGKTAVLELVRQHACPHIAVLPEAAGIVFGGGFPRRREPHARKAAQRAIYHVQRELETLPDGDNSAVVLCDRGTLDGLAYWSDVAESFFAAIGTTQEAELARYDVVIHLRTPPASAYDNSNPLRVESAQEAELIDRRIAEVWRRHPRRLVVDSQASFIVKATQALTLIQAELPTCCQPPRP